MNLTGLSVLCTSFLAGFYFGPDGISGLKKGFLLKFCTLLAKHLPHDSAACPPLPASTPWCDEVQNKMGFIFAFFSDHVSPEK